MARRGSTAPRGILRRTVGGTLLMIVFWTRCKQYIDSTVRAGVSSTNPTAPAPAPGPISTTTTTTTTTTADSAVEVSDEGKDEDLQGMGACLLVKDDNHWLIEWLAYHYHALPLQHLVYVVDPDSRTSPQSILDRYQGMIVMEAWNDTHVLSKEKIQELEQLKEKLRQLKEQQQQAPTREVLGDISFALVKIHRIRQKSFYTRCLKHFKQLKQKYNDQVNWVILTDTDEFLHVNPATLPRAWVDIPKAEIFTRRGSVVRALSLHETEKAGYPTCLFIPRIQMSVKEDLEDQTPSLDLPIWLNSSNLLTSRWIYHNGKEIRQAGENNNGKNMFDMRQLKQKQIPETARTVHFVIPKLCLKTDKDTPDLLKSSQSWLRIFHYTGTLEQYTFREDYRDGITWRPQRADVYKKTLQKMSSPMLRDTILRPWVSGLIQSIGDAEAKRLLAHVGIVGERNP